MALTQKQQSVAEFITTFREEKGFNPSLREIQNHFGFASTNAAAKHLSALEKKGFLKRFSGRARGIILPQGSGLRLHEIPIFGCIPAGWPSGESEHQDGSIRVDLHSLAFQKPPAHLRFAFAAIRWSALIFWMGISWSSN